MSPHPSVHLHIERLVLDGLELCPDEAARLEQTLTGELARHVAGAPAGGWTSAASARLQAAPIQLQASQPTSVLAAAVARSLFASVSSVTSRQHRGTTETTF